MGDIGWSMGYGVSYARVFHHMAVLCHLWGIAWRYPYIRGYRDRGKAIPMPAVCRGYGVCYAFRMSPNGGPTCRMGDRMGVSIHMGIHGYDRRHPYACCMGGSGRLLPGWRGDGHMAWEASKGLLKWTPISPEPWGCVLLRAGCSGLR